MALLRCQHSGQCASCAASSASQVPLVNCARSCRPVSHGMAQHPGRAGCNIFSGHDQARHPAEGGDNFFDQLLWQRSFKKNSPKFSESMFFTVSYSQNEQVPFQKKYAVLSRFFQHFQAGEKNLGRIQDFSHAFFSFKRLGKFAWETLGWNWVSLQCFQRVLWRFLQSHSVEYLLQLLSLTHLLFLHRFSHHCSIIAKANTPHCIGTMYFTQRAIRSRLYG